MKTKRIRVVLVVGVALGLAGCGSNPWLDALSGAMKIANGQMLQLTAAEIQALSQLAAGILQQETGQTAAPLTAEQAAAIVAFLRANNINTTDDLARIIEAAQNDPGSVQLLAELAAAFAGSSNAFDPNNPDTATIDAIFAHAFGQPPSGGG